VVARNKTVSKYTFKPKTQPGMEPVLIERLQSKCHCCHQYNWWESIYGAVACGVCHPPVKEDLVKKWYTVQPQAPVKKKPQEIRNVRVILIRDLERVWSEFIGKEPDLNELLEELFNA